MASLGLLAAAAAGCASSKGAAAPATSSPSPDVSAAAANGTMGPALLQWSGRFQGQTLHNSMTPTRVAANGDVTLTANGANVTHVVLNLSLAQYQDPLRLYWSVAPGPCGSGSIPLMTVAQFGQINMSTGSGSLEEDLGFALPTTGAYHVNVFGPDSNGQDESGVFACASMKLEQRKGT
jgi:hypothetical protein